MTLYSYLITTHNAGYSIELESDTDENALYMASHVFGLQEYALKIAYRREVVAI